MWGRIDMRAHRARSLDSNSRFLGFVAVVAFGRRPFVSW